MERIRNIMLWLIAIMILYGCASSRKTETSNHKERRDSTVVAITDSVRKLDVKADSTVRLATDESHTSGSMSEKGRGEEIIQERVTESTDAQGNKITTTDRTIHRRGGYECNSTYDKRFAHHEEQMTKLQHTIDSLALNRTLNAGTHWAKKDSMDKNKDVNTKKIKAESWSTLGKSFGKLAFFGFGLWLLVNILLTLFKVLIWARDKIK